MATGCAHFAPADTVSFVSVTLRLSTLELFLKQYYTAVNQGASLETPGQLIYWYVRDAIRLYN